MTPEQFSYWLRGFFELSGQTVLNAAQCKMVQEHLDLVFTKVTPELDATDTCKDVNPFDKIVEEVQKEQKKSKKNGRIELAE